MKNLVDDIKVRNLISQAKEFCITSKSMQKHTFKCNVKLVGSNHIEGDETLMDERHIKTE